MSMDRVIKFNEMIKKLLLDNNCNKICKTDMSYDQSAIKFGRMSLNF